MNIQQLYSDFSIPFVTEGHKHSQPGWINVECPFCTGNPGYHLGWNESEQYFHCWRCGGKFPDQVISKLLHITSKSAEKLILEYGGIKKHRASTNESIIKIRKYGFKFPSSTTSLQLQHKQYLERRRFDPDYLEKHWDLRGTGPIAPLNTGDKTIDYRHRIIAPVYWYANHIVTFQGRDITNKHSLKYMACPKERELIHHKHILYGHPSKWKQFGICVEGITDVWRLGDLSFATFGIEYTDTQLRHIALSFSRVAVMFDGEEQQALKQANKMVSELKFRGVDAFRVDITGDPADLPQQEANYIVNQLVKK